MSQSRILTNDIVEILETKIFATSAHSNIGTLAGDRYDNIIDAMSLFVLSLAQKAAFDNTATVPSALNPVVLKDDIFIYRPPQDLGEIKDSVATFADLPIVVTPSGDTLSGDPTVTNLSSMADVVVGQLVSGPGIPANAYVISVGVSDFTMNLNATATATGVSLQLNPDMSDIRPVLTLQTLYRWDGVAWNPFLSTGTVDHTALGNQNGDPNFQHLTLTERTELNSETHTHVNQAVLDAITDAGSGLIITPAERVLIPTQLEKDALAGTQGTPSSLNKYVTNQDPRLNTIKNPYVTIGHDPQATFPGQSSTVFGDVATGSNQINNVSPGDLANVALGRTVIGTGIPDFSYVTAIGGTFFQINNNATANVTAAPLLVYRTDTQTFLDAIKGITDYSCTIDVASPATVTVAGHTFADFDPVKFKTTGSLPSPLDPAVTYFIRNSTPTTFNVSLTQFGPLVNTSLAGTGDHRVGGGMSEVKAIEVLAHQVIMHCNSNFNPLVWSEQVEGMLFEGLTPLATKLVFQTGVDSLQILGPGTGAVTVRGIHFQLDGANTKGIRIDRDYCLIENCIFDGSTPLGHLHKGLTINANFVVIRKCQFKNFLTTGITVNGNNVHIEECVFDLSDPNSFGIDVVSNHFNANIDNCDFNNCTLRLQSSTENCQVSGCDFSVSATITDLGSNNRILHLPSTDNKAFGQAYYGRSRTVGLMGSAGDYRSNDQAAFIEAMADPFVTTLRVLPGTYNFTSTVVVPQGKKIKGATQGGAATQINCLSGITPFQLSSDSCLENLYIISTAAPTVIMNGITNVEVKRCLLQLNGPDTTDDFGINAINSQRFLVEDCQFTGLRGVQLDDCDRCEIRATVFGTTSISLTTNAACEELKITDNLFLSATPDLRGLRHVIDGNLFISGLPTKLNTTASVWESNYPEAANNYEGVDYVRKELTQFLEPSTPGVSRVSVNDFGGLAFTEAANSTANMLMMKIGPKVDTSAGFDVHVKWTTNVGAGDVEWLVDVVFYDETLGTLGAVQQIQTVDSRINLVYREANDFTLNFPATYGVTTPSHVSVSISRLGLLPTDDMPDSAVLLAADITLKRD